VHQSVWIKQESNGVTLNIKIKSKCTRNINLTLWIMVIFKSHSVSNHDAYMRPRAFGPW
jgi:hypothetical protein